MTVITNKKFPGTTTALAIAVLATLASPLASAAEADDTNWYFGASIGRTDEGVNFDRVFSATLPPGLAITSYTEGGKDVGFKLFTGYRFNRFVSLEAGYFDLGDFTYESTTNPAGQQFGKLGVDGWNIDVVGTLPLTQKLSALARFGFNAADTKSRFSGSGAVPPAPFSIRETNGNYKYGLGLQYALADTFDVRLEAERYRVDEPSGSKGDIDMISAGFVYRFGRTATVAAAPAPAPVVASTPPPAAAPARPPAPAAQPPAPTRVAFSADSLFDFNSSAIRPAGRAELDALAANLRGVDFDTIAVTGHTDRIGAQAYNLRLSNERAVAVKDYLVSAANIAANKITTRGVNGAEPVTTRAQCGDDLPRAQLIVCLAPDRRVEVEVSGTRAR